jgi:hypothetical protein
MSKLVFAASLMAVLVLAACSPSTPTPSQPSVSAPPASPAPVSPDPSVPTDPSSPGPVDPSDPPVVTPAPTVAPTPKPTPRPTPVSFNRAERYLIDGIMRGEGDCSPVRGGRLPADAIAGIDCDLIGSPVARAGYYLFATEGDMLDAYFGRMQAEGLEIESGDGCFDREGENAYVPYDEADGLAPYRQGCFVNDQGYGNFRVTLPGAHVYVGLLGRTAAMRPLANWAFYGNNDTPSFPTLWQQSFVYRP